MHACMQVAELQRQSQSRDATQAPYRDSKLTYFLRDTFGGNAKTILVANIAPTRAGMHDTLATLEFAQRAALVKNFVQPNAHTTGELYALHAELERLRSQASASRVCSPLTLLCPCPPVVSPAYTSRHLFVYTKLLSLIHI